MPRHLISDAHEWINEIPTVPTHAPAKPQPGERAWQIQRGKKTLLSLTLGCIDERHAECRISGSFFAIIFRLRNVPVKNGSEIPPSATSLVSFRRKDTCSWGV